MLNKQPVTINFSQGLDLKTDPKQVSLGKFLSLQNSVFDKGGLLEKRNGFKQLASLPDATSRFATTFNSNLTAIGNSIKAYSAASQTWVGRGQVNPLSLSTLSVIRNGNGQTQCDSAIADNGLMCVVYTEIVGGVNVYKYAVIDSINGQNILLPNAISSADAALGTPKVFLLGNFFVIIYTNKVSTTYHLKYFTINVNTQIQTAPVDISSTYTPASTLAFDAYVANNSLYVAYNGSDGGGAIRISRLDSTLNLHTVKVFAGRVATIMSVTADISGVSPIIYASFYNSGDDTSYTLAVDQNLNTILAPTEFLTTAIVNLTSVASSGVVTVIYENANNYGYDSAIPTHFTSSNTITVGGTVGTAQVVIRSLGLASKAFFVDGVVYFVGIYFSGFQATYFLVNLLGQVVLKLAYENAGTYLVTGLPQVAVTGNVAQFSYLFKDFIQAANKTQGASNSAPVYTQTGINLATVNFDPDEIVSTEIGNNLNISGGIVWAYDGTQSVEQGFHLYPDSVEATWATTGGSIVAQPDGTTNTDAYFYQVTYEWTDNQGNLFRSAPSLPLAVTTTGSGTTGSIVIDVPTLRVTYKVTSPVHIVIYRWSVENQTYYQVTSITSPLLNDTSADSVSFTDTLADSSILGNAIIYTTGGVVEDIGPPATSIMTLFKSRLFLVDSEDMNLLWYSKQVIESTPIEMSDLFTIYIAPSEGAQGSTGPVTALSALDDKLIIFKKDAIYYITGNGPDNTGANNDFSDPVFITSTVGCANPNSIVFIPQGLMFQSDKGIWLLGRDLSTQYIGAPVETFNEATVLSALGISGTNQVRFTLDNGITLMYDYFYDEWGSFVGIPAISSTLFEGLHTYINSFGQVFQENPGSYLDGASPVLMNFTTNWIKIAGLQGYQRIYYFYLLGTFISPHKLVLQIAYDYQPGINQQIVVSPFNYNAPYGGDAFYGNVSPYGGTPSLEQWQIHMQRQQCQAFQITMNEVFDSSYGTVAGAGLTMSGINCIIGRSKAHRPIGQRASTG